MTATSPSLSYRLLSLPLFLFWIFHAFWLALKNKRLDYLLQRIGLQAPGPVGCIWIHASSVGEVELIKPVVDHYQQQHPLLVTVFTPTGYQHARKILPPTIAIRVLPIDFLPLSWLFIRRNRIKLALVAETELWPETLYQAARCSIPLLQINARLSDKSLNPSPWIKKILQQTLANFQLHITRTRADLERLQSMQVDQGKIRVIGNLKYAGLDAEQLYPDLIGRPYILFASTHKPEEELFAAMRSALTGEILFVIAPRHPQRANEIVKALGSLDLQLAQRSKGEQITADTQIYLADTLGELKALFSHAKLIVMGGSFAPVGGHNIIEPATQGKMIITGPSDDNIKADIELLQEGQAIIQVADIEQLQQQIIDCLDHPQKIADYSAHAQQLMQQQSHILEQYINAIDGYL